MELLNNFNEEILCHDAHYIVALSGGADSVALLLSLLDRGYNVDAAHCNFHLRGKESDRDEEFVVRLCEEYAINLHRAHFDTEAYASLHHQSIEMAARELRYHYFAQLAADIGAEGICVAHHRDDNVETFFLNLFRGTGIHGLTAISEKRDNILRPMLNISRLDIEHYLRQRGQSWVNDSTNQQTIAQRNKIRLKLMPLIEELFPNATQAIATTIANLREAEKVYDAAIAQQIEATKSLEIARILTLPSPRTFIVELLQPYGFSATVATQLSNSLREAQSGKYWESDTYIAVIDHGRLVIEKRQKELPVMRWPECGTYIYHEEKHFRVKKSPDVVISRDSSIACLDAAKVRFPLTIRPIKNGDRFHPLGMQGSQLVSDFLTNRKFSIISKQRQLVVEDATGAIIWLVGLRIDNRFRITDTTTEQLTLESY